MCCRHVDILPAGTSCPHRSGVNRTFGSPQWLAYAATVALYRYRYAITDPTPLGAPKSIKIAEQTAEYRAAYARVERARQLGSMSQSEPNRRHPVSLRAL